MSDALTLRIPMPPSTNAAYANRKGPGRGRVATAALRSWKALAGARLAQTLAAIPHRPVFAGLVEITIRLPVNWRSDADNRTKAIPDLLKTHGVLIDDKARYVAGVHTVWVYDGSLGEDCEIIVRQIAPEPATRAKASLGVYAEVGNRTAVTRQRRPSEALSTQAAETSAETAASPPTAAKRPSQVSTQRGTVSPAQQAHGKRQNATPKTGVMRQLAALGVIVEPGRVHVTGGRRP
jgi:hypothetical protein